MFVCGIDTHNKLILSERKDWHDHANSKKNIAELNGRISLGFFKHDPALNLAFNELCKQMKSNEAIIRSAKKLLSTIRYVI